VLAWPLTHASQTHLYVCALCSRSIALTVVAVGCLLSLLLDLTLDWHCLPPHTLSLLPSSRRVCLASALRDMSAEAVSGAKRDRASSSASSASSADNSPAAAQMDPNVAVEESLDRPSKQARKMGTSPAPHPSRRSRSRSRRSSSRKRTLKTRKCRTAAAARSMDCITHATMSTCSHHVNATLMCLLGALLPFFDARRMIRHPSCLRGSCLRLDRVPTSSNGEITPACRHKRWRT
jgi:hypothetical protein